MRPPIGALAIGAGIVLSGCWGGSCPESNLIPLEDGDYVEDVRTVETSGTLFSPEDPAQPARLTIEGDTVVYAYVDTEGRQVEVRYEVTGEWTGW